MTRAETWTHHAASLLVGATGLAFAWLRYFAVSPDPLAAVHPWLPPVQHAHVWTAPLLVFALGLAWRAHAWTGIRSGVAPRRRSGLALLASAAPMVASGYLLQTAVEPDWRKVWLAVHLAASGLWLAGYLAHQLSARHPR